MMRLAMRVLWPSFLAAILAEGVFFSLFDPLELIPASVEFTLSPLAAYTIGFFFFWAFCALASMLTYYLATPTDGGEPPF